MVAIEKVFPTAGISRSDICTDIFGRNVAAFAFMEYLVYTFFLRLISVCSLDGFQMVVECRAGHPINL